MKELIYEFVNQYAVWGILILTGTAAFLLGRMQRQLKKLNRNLGMITGGMQEYFQVIMDEEKQEEEQYPEEREIRKESRFPAQEERKKADPEEEAVFNSVIQEFFS